MTKNFKAWMIWGLGALFYLYDYVLSVAPEAMKPELMSTFAGSAAQFGALSSIYFWSYGLMQIPVGLLVDRFGPRRLLTTACLFTVIGGALFTYADTMSVALIGRFLIGVGAAFALVCCLKIASVWFPARLFASFTGITITVGFFGAVVGLNLIGTLVDLMGWRETLKSGVIFGSVMVVLLWLVVRDKPTNFKQSQSNQITSQNSLWHDLGLILRCPQSWYVSLYAGLLFVPTLVIGAAWGIPFLSEAHGYTRQQAGTVTSMIFMGWVFGGPAFGWISDHLGKRNLPMQVANLCLLVLCVAIIYATELSPTMMSALMFGLGFFSSSFVIGFAVIKEINQPAIAGLAIGFMNGLNTFGGAAMQQIMGWILDLTGGNPEFVHGEPIFTHAQYQQAMLVLPACLVLSFILLLRLKETNCQPSY